MNRSSVLGIGRASVHAASADDRPAVQRDGVAGREVGLVAGGEKDETMLLMTPSLSGAFLARRTSTEKTPQASTTAGFSVSSAPSKLTSAGIQRAAFVATSTQIPRRRPDPPGSRVPLCPLI